MKKLYPLLLGITLIACTSNSEQKTNEDLPPINEVFDGFYNETIAIDPIWANYIGVTRYMDTLPNYLSDDYTKNYIKHFQSFLNQLMQYNRDDLTEANRLNYDLLSWQCESKIETPDLLIMLPINQIMTLNLYMTIYGTGGSIQPFNTVKDYENWLSRLEDYTLWLDQALINMQKGIELGFKQPKEIIEKTIPQWEALITTTPEGNMFFTPISNMPDEITSEDSLALADSYKVMINDKLIPRFKKITEFLKNEYLNNPRPTAGISSIPNGKEAYGQLLKFYTTTDLSPDSIFNLGKSEVNRIRGEIFKVMEAVEFNGTYTEFFEHINTNPDLMPFDDPQQVIENFNAIHERIKPRLNVLFSIKPNTPFEVRRTEAFREKSAFAQYLNGNPDGSRPGIFYIPIPNVKSYNIYRDETLFLHEAVPGHHFERMLTLENKDIMDFRKLISISAYTEGWGLYCESLGNELGLYDDPYQYFGALIMEMHRAIRLVVDVGLHYKGWTRDEAIKFQMENRPQSESRTINNIERYMVSPGQATSYKIGQLTIRALRSKAEETLGDQFDIRKFHTQILNEGPLPLFLLESKINRWIDESLETQ